MHFYVLNPKDSALLPQPAPLSVSLFPSLPLSFPPSPPPVCPSVCLALSPYSFFPLRPAFVDRTRLKLLAFKHFVMEKF